MGELARYFNAELKVGADLHVVPAAGWRRAMWFDETGLPWVRPSPNLPTLASATVYPALVAFEGSNLSVGPRHDGRLPARSARPGFRRMASPPRSTRAASPACGSSGTTSRRERPGDGKYSGQTIPGIRIVVTDRDRFSAGRTAAAILWAVHRGAPDSLVVRGCRLRRALRPSGDAGGDHARRGPRRVVVARTARPSRRGGARWRDTRSIDRSLPSCASHVSCTRRPRHQSSQPASRTESMIAPMRVSLLIAGLVALAACGPRQVEVRTAPSGRVDQPARRRCSSRTTSVRR